METRKRGEGTTEEPPALAQALLRAVVRPEDHESVQGDLLEEYRSRAVARGWTQARAEYWREVVASAPHFLIHRIERALFGRNQNMDTRSGVRQALLGLLFALPALLLVVGGVLQSAGVLADDLAGSVGGAAAGVLRTLQHPAFILGGLLVAFLLNARPVMRLGIRREPQALVGSITVRGRLWNLLSIGLALALLGAILGYAFVENFRLVPAHLAATPGRHLTMEDAQEWGRVDPPEPTTLSLQDGGTIWLYIAPLPPGNPTP